MRRIIIRFVTILICFFLLCFYARSQITVPIILHGKLTNQQNNPLSNVHVIDLSIRNGTISDKEGYYRLLVYANDTVRFSSVGYKSVLLIVPGISQDNLLRNLVLPADTINLTEYIIRPYPVDLKSLKTEFLTLELPEEKPINFHFDEVVIEGPAEGGMVIKGPFTALYEAVSRHAKVLRQYQNLIRQDKLKVTASKRYNVAIVQRITGLKDEQEVIEFMEFCGLAPDFILSVNDYDLFCAISDCYKRFINSKK